VPTPSEPITDIYGDGESLESDELLTTGSNAANSDDIRTEKNFETGEDLS